MKIQNKAAFIPHIRVSFKANSQQNTKTNNPSFYEKSKPYLYSAALVASAAAGYVLCKHTTTPKQIEKVINKETIKETFLVISEKSKEKCENILKNMSSHFVQNTYKQELEKLNNLSPVEKKYFIKFYEEKTGFPDLEKVTENIKSHITGVLEKAAAESNTRIVFSAYDKNCSIGRKLALPGTDIDEWGLVIDGTEQQINKFKEVLYGSYDQNIVNIICDHPKVYSLDEVKNYLKQIDEITNTPEFKDKSEQFIKNMNEYTGSKEKTEFISNSLFNIMLSDKFPSEETKIRAALDLSSTLETLRDGELLINNLTQEEKAIIENSTLYKYGNFLQQRWRNTLKDKHAARIDFDKKYNELEDDKKIGIIKECINASFNNKPSKDSEFGEFFNNNANNIDQPVLDAVSRILCKEVNGPV